MTKPYYERGGITLYHGDSRDVLPHIRYAELLLADPPYGIDGGRGGGNRQRGKGNYEANGWEDTRYYIRGVVVPVIEECLAKVERAIVTPGIRNMWLYPEPDDIGCFWQPAAVGFGSWGQATMGPILYYGKDPRAGIGQSPNGRQLTEAPHNNGHPCPKPLNAWRWLLAKGSLEGETVLDPFCGSGTTLRAAKDLGRNAIGIEIEERYCEIAAKRLEQEVMAL